MVSRATTFATSVFIAATAAAAPPSVDHSQTTPDFCQTDPAGEFPRGGRDFCGPTSASNAIVHLARSGFPALLPADSPADAKQAQIRLIHRLASAEFMNVTGEGTGPIPLMAAVRKYAEQAGYQADLRYQGWRGGTSPRYPRVAEVPTAEWIVEQLARPDTAVLLNVGWYNYDAATRTYLRRPGHWVTVVGYETNPSDPATLPTLLMHDPAPRSGERTQRVKLVRLTGGHLRPTGDPAKVRPRPADGFLSLQGEMVLKDGIDAAVVDVAVAVNLRPGKS